VPLGIVTVAEPLPRPLDQRAYHRLFGPNTDAGGYVGRLAVRWRDRGADVLPLALYDPLGPADGLSMYLRAQSAGLLAVTTRPRAGAANLLGSRAAAIIRMSPVPVLVVARHDAD
jgi:nucleotide-binding universal stress UspA family protein